MAFKRPDWIKIYLQFPAFALSLFQRRKGSVSHALCTLEHKGRPRQLG